MKNKKSKQKVYQPHFVDDKGRWFVGFGGNMSKRACKREVQHLNNHLVNLTFLLGLLEIL